MPALTLLSSEHVAVQGFHEHVLCSLLDLTQVHLANAHHVLLINSDDLVSKAFVFFFKDLFSPSELHQCEDWSVLIRLGIVVGGVVLARWCRRWWQGPASRPGGGQEVPDQIGH